MPYHQYTASRFLGSYFNRLSYRAYVSLAQGVQALSCWAFAVILFAELVGSYAAGVPIDRLSVQALINLCRPPFFNCCCCFTGDVGDALRYSSTFPL